METAVYSVPGVSCEHCRTAIVREVGAVTGVEVVEVDLETKVVSVLGPGLDDTAILAAIDDAGYDAVRR
jgi:copper chaperone CopZ